MPIDEKLAARVRRALAMRDDVEEKRMFGGLAFMVRGHMAVGIVKSTLMVRVPPGDYEAMLEEPHARPMDFTGRPLKGFVYVDQAGITTPTKLRRWVTRGVTFAESKPKQTRTLKAHGRAAPRRAR